MGSKWIPCGEKFIVGDVIRWIEPIWLELKKKKKGTKKKKVEKLRYVHRNPVVRGLVLEPQQWAWSSFRHYAEGERGVVLVNELRTAEMHSRKIA